MAKLSVDEIIEAVSELSLLEVNELVKKCEEKFGVSASAGITVSTTSDSDDAKEAKTEFDVELTAAGAEKIKVIKVVREITGLGLKEAKDLVDGAPKILKEGISKDDAEAIKAKLTEVGATITIK